MMRQERDFRDDGNIFVGLFWATLLSLPFYVILWLLLR
jgi:hypothetical protein